LIALHTLGYMFITTAVQVLPYLSSAGEGKKVGEFPDYTRTLEASIRLIAMLEDDGVDDGGGGWL
jgi:hypothetical protein